VSRYHAGQRKIGAIVRFRGRGPGANAGKPRPERRDDDLPFVALVGFLVLAFLTGGTSRSDAASLLVLLPVAVLFCGLALWRLRWANLTRHAVVVAVFAATVALTIVHLVPLPPAIWQALPGRGIVVEHDRLLGFGSIWRPLSLSPGGTAAVLFGLTVPAATLLLAIQLGRRRLDQLVLVMAGLGCASGIWAIFQFAGGLDSILYTYRVSKPDVATGAFANRNHQAVFLATVFPLLGVIAGASRDVATGGGRGAGRDVGGQAGRRWGALVAGVFLLPLIMTGGSRIGLVTAAVGVLAGIWLFATSAGRGQSGEPATRRIALLVAAVAVSGIVAVALLTTRSASVDRLLDGSNTQELRFKVWPLIWDGVGRYQPTGSGIGSFVPVFQAAEPDAILRPTFLNHAHNEVLEIALTTGVPGLLLLAASLGATLVWAIRAFGSGGTPTARAGAIIIILLVLGSLTDYPLRTPFLSCVIVIASLWASARPEPIRNGLARQQVSV
jgi:O-antigen ligase